MFNDYKFILGFDRKFWVVEVKGINEEKYILVIRKMMIFFVSEKVMIFIIKGVIILGFY